MIAVEQYRTKYIFLAPSDYQPSYVDADHRREQRGATFTAVESLGVAPVKLVPGQQAGDKPFGFQVIGYGLQGYDTRSRATSAAEVICVASVLHPSRGVERRPFGKTGRDVPILGQGTWQIDVGDRTAVVAALRRGIDLGMTHIDTAEMYGGAEAIVGEAIAGRRDEVFLVSKVLPENATRKGTRAACERSLRALRTDRLDVYLLHWRGSVPMSESLEAFSELAREGKIRAWGVSNFDVHDLEEVERLVGTEHLACNQVLYHLAERAIEHAVLPWCRSRGVAVVGYSPFGHGDFPKPNTARGKLLARIAAAHGATPHQVALRYLVRAAPLFTIPKASAVAHAEENARAGDLALSEIEIGEIDRAFGIGPRPRELPIL
jgi:diketogulonate reductase-like aldo/keto reductase